MSVGIAERGYTEAEIEAMETQELLTRYKQTGDETLKWPLVLRYEGLIKSAALQIRGVYSSFAQVDDIVSEGSSLTGRWSGPPLPASPALPSCTPMRGRF